MFNIVPFDAYTHCEMVRSFLFFINYYVKTLSSNESSVGCNIDLPGSLSDLYPRCSMKRYRCRASIQIILLVRATLNLKLIIRRIEARILVNLLSPIIFLSTELSYFFVNSELLKSRCFQHRIENSFIVSSNCSFIRVIPWRNGL